MSDPQEKKESTEIVLANADGTTRIQQRGKGGKFQKAGPKLIPTIEITAQARKWLHTKYSSTGKITKESKTRFEEMQQCIFEIATGTSKLDAKSQMAAVQAYEAIMLRTHGKPAINDEEKDALKQSGIRVVIIEAPKELPVSNETEREKRIPAFIDAEVVTNDPE